MDVTVVIPVIPKFRRLSQEIVFLKLVWATQGDQVSHPIEKKREVKVQKYILFSLFLQRVFSPLLCNGIMLATLQGDGRN